ncbi:hypothetical protein ACFP2F_18830 [Hymenobacter artigasi]|uniref:AraC family transcriptional regulator n=1 Tax=Hymenobacter artigasi TaxID=2719616 RepID=A0ABX1HL01_9BACT|nr:hypothetical protein [Hymenobacter artigasi]NKI90890.1 hypothetical protein [Hymenobacter artigasi]
MCEIAINISTQEEYSEIDISGTEADFASAAKQLAERSTGVFALNLKPNIYFPLPMKHLSMETVGQSKGVISALIHGAEFKLVGDSQAFRKLTDFVESLVNVPPGGHFHLDWFANADLLAPATADMSFIFSIKA